MEYVDFNKDFVERTKEIIEKTTLCEYDVTLLINCLMGLVNLPTERTKKRNTTFIKTCVNEFYRIHAVTKDSGDANKTFRALRNATSHMRIATTNSKNQIDTVQFYDKKRETTNSHTELTFSVEQLKEYALFVADEYLKQFVKKTSQSKIAKQSVSK